MANRLRTYLEDPFLERLYSGIRSAGPVRSIAVDLTAVCNLRCTGCYFFDQQMDQHGAADDETFRAFVASEKARGTNFVTVVGGEPALALDRLKVLVDNFRVSVATNGIRKIPMEGFENLPIGVAVWGDHATDEHLRGAPAFAKGLRNYRDDPRAFWYYTVAPGHAHEIPSVVEQCVENGNRVLFNFYCDLTNAGGALDYRRGFDDVLTGIEQAIARYPDRVLMNASFARVVATGQLFDQQWGHATCTSVSSDHPANAGRIANGNPYSPHFRAYNADFQSTRRCCTGVDRDCDSCFDTWEHYSWVILNMKKHLGSKRDFTDWLSTTYLFYLINRIVDFEAGIGLLPEIHRRGLAPAAREAEFGHAT